MLLVFNPILFFSVANHDIGITWVLIAFWIWFVVLFVIHTFNFCMELLKILGNYFERKTCLHFVGNMFGRKLSKTTVQLLSVAVIAPLIASIPIITNEMDYVNQEAAKFALDAKDNWQKENPLGTKDEAHNEFKDAYNRKTCSSIKGHIVDKAGLAGPGNLNSCDESK